MSLNVLSLPVTGLVQDPGVFERFTQAIQSGQIPSGAVLVSMNQPSSDIVSVNPPSPLSKSDMSTLIAVYSNLSSLLRMASSNGVRIAFDAEQSWYQPALSKIVTLLAKEFNRIDDAEFARPPIVYNTYQANLKETEVVIREDLKRAKEGGERTFHFVFFFFCTDRSNVRLFTRLQARQRSVRHSRERASCQDRSSFESVAE